MINSIPMDKPIEVLNITSINPLVSKCDIKVCYVSDEPNRNNSIITKEMGKKIAASLPGSPIVGHYNKEEKDFEQHNRILEFVDGKLTLTADTKPYGFCDVNAPVWFQWFNDDGVAHEYLMTQGYLWTGQYEEAKGIINNGNNQSMELNQKSVKGSWTKDSNGLPQFFIINEAIIENLCILGREVEPCFEGAQITSATEFALNDSFKTELFALMEQMKKILNKGGTPVFTTYAVEIGDSLWNAIYDYLLREYPDPMDKWCSLYRIEGVFEENNQKFAIVQECATLKYYRLDFSVNDAEGFVPGTELVEVTATYTPAENPQFAEDAVAEYAAAKRAEAEPEEQPEEVPEEVEETEAEESEPEQPEEEEVPVEEEAPEEEEPAEEPTKYVLDEIPEYVELQTQFAAANAQIAELTARIDALVAENNELTTFKANIDREAKRKLIDTFYMLSDADKQDCVDHIDTYSLDDIEAKLSIICVRNKVSFDLDNHDKAGQPKTFNLSGINVAQDPAMPAWVQRVKDVAKNGNI